MITVTLAAQEKITQQLTRRGHGVGLKIGLKTTGCSGYSYIFEFLDQISADLVCVHSDQIEIYTDSKYYHWFQGMTIDYVRKGLNEGFEFVNPNEGDRCGCGQSFSI